MEILNKRIASTNNSSLGLLYIDNVPKYYIIEDEPRTIKVKGETRIPSGRYKLGICKVDTPLTIKHRNSQAYKGWFKYHIQLLNVPNFEGIFIHIGNTEKDTAGCQLPNMSVKLVDGEFVGMQSGDATKEFYEKVYPLLEKGVDVYYTIIDADK